MTKEEIKNIITIPFLTNLLAVILGIVITFAVQEKIDQKHEMEGIEAGLNLVNKELATNIEYIRVAHQDLIEVSNSAKYLYAHIKDLKTCPQDSVNFHWQNLRSKSYLTLPEDALQLLKSTYLYSDMLDRELSLNVVSAYDICQAIARMLNTIEERRINSIEKIDDFFLVEADKGKGDAGIQTWISSFQGKKLLESIAAQDGYWIDPAIQDIEKAMSVINAN